MYQVKWLMYTLVFIWTIGCPNYEKLQSSSIDKLPQEKILATREMAFQSSLPGIEEVKEEDLGRWDDYFVILWAEPKDNEVYFHTIRKLGVNAGMLYRGHTPDIFGKYNFPFYMENITRGLYIKNTSTWEDSWKGYEKYRDKKFLIRSPCLNDPVYQQEQKDLMKKLILPCLPYKPLAYDIRDEPSVTTLANPFDFCFCPICMAKFRVWLKSKYSTLNELNRKWETTFKRWDEVFPLTTDEIKKREDNKLNTANFSPWADHRSFMDDTFREVVAEFYGYVKSLDEEAYCGLAGTQMPHAFGGYDYWKLLKAVNWLEPYDIRSSRELVRSFAPHIPVVSTAFERDKFKLSQKLWALVLHQDMGVIIWPFDEDMKNIIIDEAKKDFQLTSIGEDIKEVFWDLRSGIPKLLALTKRQHHPIAIHYSHASIQADWMFESKKDGKTWIKRFSSYEDQNNKMAQNREFLTKLIEDLGFQYNFLSYEQIEQGELIKGKYRVLFMPRSIAISDKEADQIRQFVKSGGILIADILCGRMNEHCKMRNFGILDDLFGIKHEKFSFPEFPSKITLYLPSNKHLKINSFFEKGLKTNPRFPKGKINNTIPAFISKSTSHGKTWYLNFDFTGYDEIRLRKEGIIFRETIAKIIEDSGLKPDVLVTTTKTQTPVKTIEIVIYRDKLTDYIAIHPNLSLPQEIERKIRIKFPYKAHIYEITTNRYFGFTDTITTNLNPYKPNIFALLSYKVQGLEVDMAGKGKEVEMSVLIKAISTKIGNHVVNLKVFDESGNPLYENFRNLFLKNGRFSETIKLIGTQEGKRYTFKFTDVTSGNTATTNYLYQPRF